MTNAEWFARGQAVTPVTGPVDAVVALVAVAQLGGEEDLAPPDARQDLRRIRLDRHATAASVATLPPPKITGDATIR